MHHGDMVTVKHLATVAACFAVCIFNGEMVPKLSAEDTTVVSPQPNLDLSWYADFPPGSSSQLYISIPPQAMNRNVPFSVLVKDDHGAEDLGQEGTLKAGENQIVFFELPLPESRMSAGQISPTAHIRIGDTEQRLGLKPLFYHQVQSSKNQKNIDADLSDWGPLSHVVQKPFWGFGEEFWTGPEDSWFAFDTALDEENLLIAIRVMDDEVHGNAGQAPWEQDGFEIRLDLRDQPRPQGERIQRENGITLIAASPGEEGLGSHIWNPRGLPDGTVIETQITKTGWNAEIKIPLTSLKDYTAAEGAVRAIRVNIAINDHDFHKPPGQAQGKQLWWRPDWRKSHYTKSGIFLLPSQPLG